MKTKKFANFFTLMGRASVVNAEIRFITNPSHKNFGKCSIYTDTQFNPVIGHPLHDYFAMTEEDALKVLSETGFIPVKPDFNWHNSQDIEEIKPKLKADWLETYNLWANFTG